MVEMFLRREMIGVILLLIAPVSFSQNVDEQIREFERQLNVLKDKRSVLETQVNELKLEKIRDEISSVGLPELKVEEELVVHNAFSLVYSEQHEQAKWVSHILTSDIIDVYQERANDFREDPLVKTRSSIDEDYFSRTLKAGSIDQYNYNSYGYDRGHLAPSADFRWSKTAMSESYFYSNISPQLGAFNQGKWAELESMFRNYIYEHQETQLYIVTGPLLTDSLAVIKKSINDLSIPEYFFKVALDLQNRKAIAFLLPNKEIDDPLSVYAMSINQLEEEIGINFFHQLGNELEEELEEQLSIGDWISESSTGDVEPLSQLDLPEGVYNTIEVKKRMGSIERVTVKGKVVGTKKTRNGNLFFNLDKNYPNHIFSILVKKNSITNFSYDPLIEWKGKEIKITGEVLDFDGVPTIVIEEEGAIEYE